MDPVWMPCRRRRAGAARAALAALALVVAGCLMPATGTPVFVDSRSGSYWSGKGLLLAVSEDETRCRVSVRDRALIVRTKWVDCTSVHPRSGR